VAKIREQDLKMVPLYNRAPEGCYTRFDAERLLHTGRLPRKIRSRKVGRLRFFKKEDVDRRIPPEWATPKLRKEGADGDMISAYKASSLFEHAVKATAKTALLNRRQYVSKADLLKVLTEKLAPAEQ
jgi:hypothetical protein